MKLKINIPKFKIPKIKIYGIDVIKNFLFFTLFIIITLIAIAFIIAPSIRYFKKHQKTYYETRNGYLQVKKEYENTLTSLNKLKRKDAKIITAFRREFNKNNFITFASKYMQVKNIEKNETKIYKNDFLRTTYFVNAVIKSPKNFYDFINALKNYKYVIKVYFPIDFEKNGSNIILKLKLEHYRLKNLNALKAEVNAH
ncbi:hypothetical protein [Caminibacter sp.]